MEESGFRDTTGYKIFGGSKLSDNFAMEASYIKFGNSRGPTYRAYVQGSGNVSFATFAETDGFTVSAVPSYPVNEQFSVFGKIGMLFWDVTTTAYGGGVSASTTVGGSDIFLGFGGEYTTGNNWGFRAEYEMYTLKGNAGSSDINLLSVGVLYRF